MEQNPTIPLIEVAADTAMRTVTERISIQSIEDASHIDRTIISLGMSHKNYNGKPYYYTPQVTEGIQAALTTIGSQLAASRCSLSPLTQDESPLCYGQDIVDQMAVLRQTVKLSYIFETRMGKNKRWRDNRLTRSVPKMTGRISQEEIEQINMIIKEIAVSLISIRLI